MGSLISSDFQAGDFHVQKPQYNKNDFHKCLSCTSKVYNCYDIMNYMVHMTKVIHIVQDVLQYLLIGFVAISDSYCNLQGLTTFHRN